MSYTDDAPLFFLFLREKVPIILESDIKCKSSFTIKNVQNILYKIIKSFYQYNGEAFIYARITIKNRQNIVVTISRKH